jgi:hypothetical protein
VSKTLQGQNWNLTPAADGRRYSKFPDGTIDSFDVYAYTPGHTSDIAYQIYDPVAETWGAWITGDSGTAFPPFDAGTVTLVSGSPLAGPFAFEDQTGVAVDTLVESNAVTISSEGHQIKIRRRSSASYNTSRIAYAVINGVQSSPWTIHTVVSADPPPPGDRDDVLLEISFNTATQDYFNPRRNFNDNRTTAVDGYQWRIHPADIESYQGNTAQKMIDGGHPDVLNIPHVEIRGAKAGADFAPNGEHVLEGDRAILLYTYHYEHPTYVPYNDAAANFPYGTGSAARARIDTFLTYLPTLFSSTSPRYGDTRGMYHEFWYGFSLWLPPNHIFDKGTYSNLGIMTFGEFNEFAAWGMLYPTISSGSQNILRFNLRNWNGSIGTELHLHWPLSAAEMASQKGTHNHYVIHFKADPRTAAEGYTGGFFRAWHNVTGQAPRLIVQRGWPNKDARYGYKRGAGAHDYFAVKGFANYKSGMHDRTGAGTGGFVYGGLLGKTPSAGASNHAICLGYDAIRLLGNQGNFQSAHPLMQAPPDPSIPPLVA